MKVKIYGSKVKIKDGFYVYALNKFREYAFKRGAILPEILTLSEAQKVVVCNGTLYDGVYFVAVSYDEVTYRITTDNDNDAENGVTHLVNRGDDTWLPF